MHPVIVPYKIGSASAKALALCLSTKLGKKVRRVKADSETFRPKLRHVVINWGCNNLHWNGGGEIQELLNLPSSVAIAQNKLLTLQVLATHPEINIPLWTTDIHVAEEWPENTVVLSRTILNGHSGHGIIVNDGAIAPAPLYVQYKKKKKEFRVHVFNNKVIDIQEKRKEREADGVNYLIRNRANGWVFCRDNLVEPQGLRDQALAAVSALGLDFGAVDIIWNEKENKCYVLEVNTAPGLEGSTLENYANAIMEVL
jgi:glutathione synthase/RimK-type ligase-like ATP-grasp enzyme